MNDSNSVVTLMMGIRKIWKFVIVGFGGTEECNIAVWTSIHNAVHTLHAKDSVLLAPGHRCQPIFAHTISLLHLLQRKGLDESITVAINSILKIIFINHFNPKANNAQKLQSHIARTYAIIHQLECVTFHRNITVNNNNNLRCKQFQWTSNISSIEETQRAETLLWHLHQIRETPPFAITGSKRLDEYK